MGSIHDERQNTEKMKKNNQLRNRQSPMNLRTSEAV